MKDMLKNGYIIQLRNGSRYCVLKNTHTIETEYDFILVNEDWDYVTSDEYNNQLIHMTFSDLDIVEVYKLNDEDDIPRFYTGHARLVWRRTSLKEGNIVLFEDIKNSKKELYVILKNKYGVYNFYNLNGKVNEKNKLLKSDIPRENILENYIPTYHKIINVWENMHEFVWDLEV